MSLNNSNAKAANNFRIAPIIYTTDENTIFSCETKTALKGVAFIVKNTLTIINLYNMRAIHICSGAIFKKPLNNNGSIHSITTVVKSDIPM